MVQVLMVELIVIQGLVTCRLSSLRASCTTPTSETTSHN